ncbi:MAG: hypothetical protein ACRDT1_15430 [Micromonosporaceae bacterium]
MSFTVDPHHGGSRHAATTSDRGWRPARLGQAGGLVSAAGFGMLLMAGLLAPHTDADRAAYAVEALLGGPRSRLVLLFSGFGTFLLLVGMLVAAVAGAWALWRAAATPPPEPRARPAGALGVDSDADA